MFFSGMKSIFMVAAKHHRRCAAVLLVFDVKCSVLVIHGNAIQSRHLIERKKFAPIKNLKMLRSMNKFIDKQLAWQPLPCDEVQAFNFNAFNYSYCFLISLKGLSVFH